MQNSVKIITIRAIYLLCLFGLFSYIISLPSYTKAQTAAQSDDSSPNLEAAVTDSKEDEENATKKKNVTLLVTVSSSKNQRYLGGVKLTFKSDNTTSKFSPLFQNNNITTTDPPPPGGYKIEQFLAGKYEVIAERKGYKTYDEIVEISDELTIADLEIKLEPLQGTPVVNESDVSNYQNTLESYYEDLYSGNFGGNYAYNNPYGMNMFSSQNNSNVYNPFSTYPQYNNPYNLPSGYQNQALINQQNQFGQTNLPIGNALVQNSNYFDSSGYSVQATTNGVYLVNRLNQLDNRQLIFVDRGDGLGGAVFMRDYTSANLPSSYGVWFISLYNRSPSGEITISPSVFSRTVITPQQFASTYSKTAIDQFSN